MHIGQVIKQARQNRNITQSELSKDIISRTSLVKIENETQNPSFHTVIKLLEKLGLSITEVYQSDPESPEFMYNNIIDEFKHLFSSTQSTEITKLLYNIYIYEQKNNNPIIQNIKIVLNAFKNIDQKSIKELQYDVLPVWNYVEQIDSWSEIDLYMINFLLYFFEIKTAENLVKRAINKIELTYPHLKNLKNSFLINLSYLYLLENNTPYAQYYIYKSYSLSQQLKRYDLMCLNKIRMAIIKKDKKEINNEIKNLESFNDTELILGIKQEIEMLNHKK